MAQVSINLNFLLAILRDITKICYVIYPLIVIQLSKHFSNHNSKSHTLRG